MPETLETIAEKISALGASTVARFDATDKRFDAVDTRLETMDKRFDAVDTRLETMDKRFDAIDKRFDSVDARFEAVDKEFVSVSQALAEQREYTEFAFAKLKEELSAEMNGGFSRLDRKIDRVLELLTVRPRRRRRS